MSLSEKTCLVSINKKRAYFDGKYASHPDQRQREISHPPQPVHGNTLLKPYVLQLYDLTPPTTQNHKPSGTPSKIHHGFSLVNGHSPRALNVYPLSNHTPPPFILHITASIELIKAATVTSKQLA